MALKADVAASFDCKDMSACDKVVNTVELLDNILEFVPLKQVFVLQRINNTFYNHIRGDTRTAQLLHLRPRRNGLQEIFPSLKHMTSDNWICPVSDPEYRGTSRQRLFTADISGTGEPEHGSWEDILVTQPPIKNLGVWRLDAWYGFAGYAQIATFESGVTLGAIYKAVRDVIKNRRVLKMAVVSMQGEDMIEVDFVQRWVDALPRTSSVPAGFGFK